MQRFPESSSSGADQAAELELLDLTCPACGADLIGDALFLSHRTCGRCNRHFSIGPRERVTLLVDGGAFQEIEAALEAAGGARGPDRFPSAERLAERQHLQVIGDAVVSGTGRIGGVQAVIVALDDHFIGPSLGALMTEKIILAGELARTRRLPLVILCAGGTSSAQAGPLAVVQGGRLATTFAQLHLDGLPIAGVLAHPLAGSLFGILAAQCDYLVSEPGVRVGPESAGHSVPDAQQWRTVEELLADGWIDAIVERSRLRAQLGRFLDLTCNPGMARPGATPGGLDGPWPTAAAALASLDHPGRPGADSFLTSLVSGFLELRGDRIAGETDAVTCGFGRLESRSVALAVQRRTASGGHDATVTAARKLARLARLAGRLEMPLVTIVDAPATPPNEPFAAAEPFAIGSLASGLSMLPAPVVSVGIGRVAGPLAAAMMVGDRQLLLSHAVYASPAGVMPGLGAFPSQPRTPSAPGWVTAEPGLLAARDCERLGLVNGVIPEPASGAHDDPQALVAAVRVAVLASIAELAGSSPRRLLDARRQRQRTLGQSTPEGLAAARSELWELHEWQRSVGRSIDEWRERWEQIKASQPRMSFHRPDMNELAARLRARRSELLERARLGDRSADQVSK